MRTIVTLTPQAKLKLTSLTNSTQQSEGKIISNLIVRFGNTYLKLLEKSAQEWLISNSAVLHPDKPKPSENLYKGTFWKQQS